MKTILIAVTAGILSVALGAQTRVVRGDLTMFNEFGVHNVQVEAKKAKTTVTTNEKGQFELVCKERDVIRVKNDVFESWSKRVNKNTDYVSANLIFRDTPENREIATGMGYISQDNLSYALAHLQDQNNDFCGYTDVFSLIQGKFSSVEIKTTPEGRKGIFMRGQRSLTGSNEAIYVVDGIRVTDIAFVQPCDMRSIDFLKGGAASLYGSQGANGVVVIETKSENRN